MSESLTMQPHIRRGVIGILSRGDEFLMIQRALCVPKGGCWCFPGGHIERGENSRVAVQRELVEELGVIVTPVRKLGAVRIHDSRHVLAVWRVEYRGEDFRLASDEISDIRWVSLDEISRITPGLASNALVLEMLRS